MKADDVVIAVSGSPGSGKTTYARYLADALSLRFFSGGMAFRELAKERGLSLVELNRLAAKDARIDIELERRILEEAKKGGVVIESHLAGWTLRNIADLLIYVKADLRTRLERIASRERKNIKEIAVETMWREVIEAERFRDLYAIDITDLSYFDIVLDTTFLDEDEAKRLLLTIVRAVLSGKMKRYT